MVPDLLNGWLLFPHLGEWIQAGQPESQEQEDTISHARRSISGNTEAAFSARPTPPGTPS